MWPKGVFSAGVFPGGVFPPPAGGLGQVHIDRTILWNVHSLVGLSRTILWNVEVLVNPPAPEPCGVICVDTERCNPFPRVEIDFMVEGVSRITWDLRDDFLAPTPYTFQLQVGDTGNPLADDWEDVGIAVTDAFTMTDPTRRVRGKQLTTHYRVKLTDADDQIYYSQPATALGQLTARYWLAAREIIRQVRLSFRKGPGGLQGFLLKKKRKGSPCTRCLDQYTGEVTDSECPICSGTGYIVGYYRAMPCQFGGVTPVSIDEQRTAGPEGWSAETAIQGRFIGSPLLSTGDIWVNAANDLRYHVETVKCENQLNGVPLTLYCQLWQLPFSHLAYRLPLE
jgi:hypothetical protein